MHCNRHAWLQCLQLDREAVGLVLEQHGGKTRLPRMNLAGVANERPWVYRAAEWPGQHGRWAGRYCVSSTARAGQAAGGAKQRGPRPNARYISLAFYALHRRVAAAPVATSRPR